MEKEVNHKNHRKRLKNKVEKHGLDCLAYHEILELLLTYVIPRKDTNPIAHKLMNYFGLFSSVIDADYHDLLKIEGMGKESALFFNVLSQLFEMYNKSKQEATSIVLDNTDKCVSFFRERYRIKDEEIVVVVSLSKNKRVLNSFLFKGQDETEVRFDLNKIIKTVTDHGVSSIVMFHTHPYGDVYPSNTDVLTTQKICNLCMANGLELSDHIILNESSHYSFFNEGVLDRMRNKFKKIFDDTSLCAELLNKKK